MNKTVTLLAACGLLAITCAVAFSAGDPAQATTLLSHLKPGQLVRLERAPSGGYDIHVLNERYVKAIQENESDRGLEELKKIGRDFILVEFDRGITKVISVNAIDSIAMLSKDYGSGSDDATIGDPE